jgi:hypothetical protein
MPILPSDLAEDVFDMFVHLPHGTGYGFHIFDSKCDGQKVGAGLPIETQIMTMNCLP